VNFNFLKSLSGRAEYLGVDIGTTSVKIVELMETGGHPALRNYGILESYGHLERLNNAIQTSNLKMLDTETAELLRVLLKNLKTKTKNAIASLPPFLSFTALLDIPVMPPAEMARAMQYQARQFVPLPITEVTIDWMTVGEREDEKGAKFQQVFLVSVPNEHIRKYQKIFTLAGLNLKALEVEGVSLARLLTTGDPTESLIVDIGSRSTSISVAAGGSLKYSVQTDIAGGSLTQTISGGLGINIQRAEELKKRLGILGRGGEYELSSLMLPYLDVILGEVKRVKETYEKTYKNVIERVIITGGGANLLGIEKYMEQQFNLPIVKAAPFKKIEYPSHLEPIIEEVGTTFSVALGLGIRQFI